MQKKNIILFLVLFFSISFLPFPLSAGTCRKNIQHIKGAETITSIDLDADGNMDLAYTAWLAKELDGELWVAWNNGDGTFMPKRIATNLKWARDVKVCNLSNSSLPGLCVSAYKSGHFYFSQTSARRFTRHTIDAAGYGSVTFAVGHLNSDKLQDIVTAQEWRHGGEEGHVKIWINLGDNRFENIKIIRNVKDVASLEIIRNKDGSSKIILAHSGIEKGLPGLSIYVFRENILPIISHHVTGPLDIINTREPLEFSKTAYINNDETLDYIAATRSGLWWVDGMDFLKGGSIDDKLKGHYFSAAGDLDGDGLTDVASVSLMPSNEVNIYWQKSPGVFVRQNVNKGDGGRGIEIFKNAKDREIFLAVSSFGANRVDLYSTKCSLD